MFADTLQEHSYKKMPVWHFRVMISFLKFYLHLDLNIFEFKDVIFQILHPLRLKYFSLNIVTIGVIYIVYHIAWKGIS